MKKLINYLDMFDAWADRLEHNHPYIAAFIGTTALALFYIITIQVGANAA